MEQFDELCDAAMAAFGEELGTSYESSLLRVLEFVKSNLEFRKEFIPKFEAILMSNNSPFEVVAFCMRELQWPEIKDFVILEMDLSQDPRSEVLRDVLTAYDEFWPDADLYKYYDDDDDDDDDGPK
ncbi:hypothetical protein [Pseudomonas syringae group sp. J309-1]|uniref:hypothetical protein n=1 Tax=Pseudomonas syringae group sp. J309-1 TaxID=3079588 RepID=UPI00290D3CAD|nr:hypothetical protein [Pseudomonas syringae group sp. J309-1]MDU8359242.1 hypothetical protein [Pseudomonas syringae group sp. J309-1]